MSKNMFNPGIEPGTVCVLSRRDNHYTNWTNYILREGDTYLTHQCLQEPSGLYYAVVLLVYYTIWWVRKRVPRRVWESMCDKNAGRTWLCNLCCKRHIRSIWNRSNWLISWSMQRVRNRTNVLRCARRNKRHSVPIIAIRKRVKVK